MKIGIVGAGAIGGYLGVMLALAGDEVTFIARGESLAAIRAHGMKLIMADGSEHVAPVRAEQDMAAAGPQDAVIIAVKANVLPELAPAMRALYAVHTIVVTAQNGIPWWYFYRSGGEHEGYQIKAVDPDGVLARSIEPERVIGAVVYPAAEKVAPGVIAHKYGNRFLLGEPDGSRSERVQQLSARLTQAGFKAPVRTDIRSDIWIKLWGNLAFNPVSALTRATLEELATDALVAPVIHQMMYEGQQIGERLGVRFPISIEQRMQGAQEAGAHKTSTLQDIEAGRETEIEALLGAVLELGQLTGVATPLLQSMYACVKLLESKQMQRG